MSGSVRLCLVERVLGFQRAERPLSQSAWAARTKSHTLGGLDNRHSCLMVLEAGCPRSMCLWIWFLGRTCFLASRGHHLAVSSHDLFVRERGKEKNFSSLLHIRALIPSWGPPRMISLEPIFSQGPHFQILSYCGLKLQHMNLRGYKHSVHISHPWMGNQPRKCLWKGDVFDPCLRLKEIGDQRENSSVGKPSLPLPLRFPALGRPAGNFSPIVRMFLQGTGFFSKAQACPWLVCSLLLILGCIGPLCAERARMSATH